jgi:transcriptional regulator with XRE-family HTH domain
LVKTASRGLKQYFKKTGETYTDAAERFGINQGTLSAIANGKRTELRQTTVDRLGKIIDMNGSAKGNRNGNGKPASRRSPKPSAREAEDALGELKDLISTDDQILTISIGRVTITIKNP